MYNNPDVTDVEVNASYRIEHFAKMWQDQWSTPFKRSVDRRYHMSRR